jgi:hypothetical protein
LPARSATSSTACRAKAAERHHPLECLDRFEVHDQAALNDKSNLSILIKKED